MRLAILVAVVVLGCGGGRPPPTSGPPAAAEGFAATRWVPASPTFVLAAPTVKDAQRGLRDVIDAFGMLVGVDVQGVSTELSQLLAVDPLSTEALTAIGIDVEGGLAIFSEDTAPTFVVHLSSPEATQAFFDRQRERGLVTQSVMVDRTEVFTAQLLANVKVSWAIADGWLWVHVTPPFAAKGDASAWFTNSHGPRGGERWSTTWAWARKAGGLASPSVVGFLDPQQLLAAFVGRVPDAMACAKLLAPVRGVAIAIEGDATHAAGRLAFDLGPAAAGVTAMTLPIPEGFRSVAAGAPLAAQWNLDALAVRGWLQPCLATTHTDLGFLDRYGVRAGRAVLLTLDPDDKSGAGAVALDLLHARFFTSHLDDIPLRSTLERSRTFGPHKGHALTIPFVASVDYVLADTLALAGIGDGVLARVVGSGAVVPGPLAAIDVVPGGLSADAWKLLLRAVEVPSAERVVERLLRWKDGHLQLAIEGTDLVLSASGTRR